jgi:hypothetical protein
MILLFKLFLQTAFLFCSARIFPSFGVDMSLNPFRTIKNLTLKIAHKLHSNVDRDLPLSIYLNSNTNKIYYTHEDRGISSEFIAFMDINKSLKNYTALEFKLVNIIVHPQHLFFIMFQNFFFYYDIRKKKLFFPEVGVERKNTFFTLYSNDKKILMFFENKIKIIEFNEKWKEIRVIENPLGTFSNIHRHYPPLFIDGFIYTVDTKTWTCRMTSEKHFRNESIQILSEKKWEICGQISYIDMDEADTTQISFVWKKKYYFVVVIDNSYSFHSIQSSGNPIPEIKGAFSDIETVAAYVDEEKILTFSRTICPVIQYPNCAQVEHVLKNGKWKTYILEDSEIVIYFQHYKFIIFDNFFAFFDEMYGEWIIPDVSLSERLPTFYSVIQNGNTVLMFVNSITYILKYENGEWNLEKDVLMIEESRPHLFAKFYQPQVINNMLYSVAELSLTIKCLEIPVVDILNWNSESTIKWIDCGEILHGQPYSLDTYVVQGRYVFARIYLGLQVFFYALNGDSIVKKFIPSVRVGANLIKLGDIEGQAIIHKYERNKDVYHDVYLYYDKKDKKWIPFKKKKIFMPQRILNAF